MGVARYCARRSKIARSRSMIAFKRSWKPRSRRRRSMRSAIAFRAGNKRVARLLMIEFVERNASMWHNA